MIQFDAGDWVFLNQGLFDAKQDLPDLGGVGLVRRGEFVRIDFKVELPSAPTQFILDRRAEPIQRSRVFECERCDFGRQLPRCGCPGFEFLELAHSGRVPD